MQVTPKGEKDDFIASSIKVALTSIGSKPTPASIHSVSVSTKACYYQTAQGLFISGWAPCFPVPAETPRRLVLKTPIDSLSCSETHCLLVSKEGEAFACGLNRSGCLGVRQNADRLEERVESVEKVELFPGGGLLTCLAGEGCSLGVTFRGKLFVWGR